MSIFARKVSQQKWRIYAVCGHFDTFLPPLTPLIEKNILYIKVYWK